MHQRTSPTVTGPRHAGATRALATLATLITLAFTLSSCPVDCDFPGRSVPLRLEHRVPAGGYATGDTVRIGQQFPARFEEDQQPFTLAEAGGAFTVGVFRVGEDDRLTLATREDLEPVATGGGDPLRDPRLPATAAAATFRFGCPAERCTVELAYRIRRPGRYVFQVFNPEAIAREGSLTDCGFVTLRFLPPTDAPDPALAELPLPQDVELPSGSTNLVSADDPRGVLLYVAVAE